jgi:hypothetical protein
MVAIVPEVIKFMMLLPHGCWLVEDTLEKARSTSLEALIEGERIVFLKLSQIVVEVSNLHPSPRKLLNGHKATFPNLWLFKLFVEGREESLMVLYRPTIFGSKIPRKEMELVARAPGCRAGTLPVKPVTNPMPS